MPLPKVVAPTFELNLISSQKAVKYRPFLVKEEKALLIAMENGSEKDITATIKNVLKGCMMSRVKIDDLPSFDLEYLFLNVRGKSVGETVDLIVTCEDDGETTVPITIGLSDIKLHIPDGHDDTIDIGGGISIKMKYPSMQQFLENNFIAPPDETNQDRIDKAFESVAGCIDQVFTEEEAWSASDCTKKELLSFIESLNSQQFGKIENFFTTMPRLQYKSTVKNPKTDVESEVVIEGLSNFFA